MDIVGWFIVTLHQMLGHNKAAAVIGCPPYNRNACILCRYERGEATKADVEAAIGGDHEK
jgi:hypothetical protein